MVNVTINGKDIRVKRGTTILEAAEKAGYRIPRLCFLKKINEIGACRVCLVEIEGKHRLVAACNNVVEEGMRISTNSPRVQDARRMNVEFILSQHDYRCATCVRNQNCSLQELARELNIIEVPFPAEVEPFDWDSTFPLIRDGGKCIKCMRCVQICDKVQSMNVWDIVNTGKRTRVNTTGNLPIRQTDCTICGQCITHCPTGALRERNDTEKVMRAVMDPEKIVIAQIAPAVRAAWGEELGLSREEASVGKMVAAARQIGFDYVFDTDFSADLTIMEEASELLERLKEADAEKADAPEGSTVKTGSPEAGGFPMFTSCCPGWVRFVKARYPEWADHLSTAKSPQQMFGAIAKSYYADLLGVEPDTIVCVSIMPCTAKKYECDVPEINGGGAGKDVDISITTREFVRMLGAAQVSLEDLEDEDFDAPLGIGTGAGVIFGVTGGVMEAALRSAFYFAEGKNPGPDDFSVVRGEKGIREVTVTIAGKEVRAAVVTGLANAEKLMQRIRKGKAQYDFVEVMACPGGCVGGGGQPIHDGMELAKERGERLYDLDAASTLRFSHENPAIRDVYDHFLGQPLSERAHELLHTRQADWTM